MKRKIDFSSIFSRKQSTYSQNNTSKLSIFFDKNILDADLAELKKLVNGLNYMAYLYMDPSVIDIINPSSPDDSPDSGIISKEDGGPTRGIKLSSKSEAKEGSFDVYTLMDNVMNIFRRPSRNTKAAPVMEDPAKIYFSTYFMSAADGKNIYKLIDSSMAEVFIKAYDIIQSSEYKDKCISTISSIFSSIGGSLPVIGGLPIPFLLNNTDNSCDTETNYISNLLFALSEEATDELIEDLSRYLGEDKTSQFIQMLKDYKYILIERDGDFVLEMLPAMLTLSLLRGNTTEFTRYMDSLYDDVHEEHPDWSKEQIQEEVHNRVDMSYVKSISIDKVDTIIKKDLLSLKFIDMSFDDTKMEVFSFKDYYNKRKAIQYPQKQYDECGLELMYSLPLGAIRTTGNVYTMNQIDDYTMVVTPDWEDGLSAFQPFSVLPLREYKDYIIRLRQQIKDKYGVDDYIVDHSNELTTEDAPYDPTSQSWEENFNHYIQELGIHEDTSVVLVRMHRIIGSSIFIVDLYNQDMKINGVSESFKDLAKFLVDTWDVSESDISNLYEYIFRVEPNEELNLSSNSDKSEDIITSKETRSLPLVLFGMRNMVELIPDNTITHDSPNDTTYVQYPAHMEAQLYDSKSRTQIHSIIEDSHVVLDGCTHTEGLH